MPTIDSKTPPVLKGGWQDAEALRCWSFARRTPQQRLDWLVEALTIRYLCRAEPRGDIALDSAGKTPPP